MNLDQADNAAGERSGGGEAAPAVARVGPVTISEAARRLDINKATVSRQVTKLGLAKDAAGRIDFEDYCRRRESDLNPLMARGGGMADAPAPAANPVRSGSTAKAAHNHNNELKRLQVEELQLKLDEKRGTLIERARVNEVLQTGSRELRDTLLGLPTKIAEDLASMTDVAEIKRRLDDEIRRMLTALAVQFGRIAQDEEGAAAAPQGEAA